jgi:hypothetical protein
VVAAWLNMTPDEVAVEDMAGDYDADLTDFLREEEGSWTLTSWTSPRSTVKMPTPLLVMVTE